MAFVSLIALIVGLVPWIIWHDEAYCRQNPQAGSGMRVDRPCYEVLATSSTWEGVVGNFGAYLFLGSVVGFAVALWWWFQDNVRKR
jgi:hypothetical protein